MYHQSGSDCSCLNVRLLDMKQTINMDVRRKLVKNMNKTEGGSVLIHISS